jgi:hypothetical protein
MKYIISEQQNMLIRVLRRVEGDFDVIWDIVDWCMYEHICNFNNYDEYYGFVCLNSAKTYLNHYFNSEHEEGYSKMEEYIIDFIKKNFTSKIKEYWVDNKWDC